jgi:hypothetical protein
MHIKEYKEESMTDCKFVDSKITQGILHEYCQNQTMLEINKPKDGKPLICVGPTKCGNAIKNDCKT